ncbi:uncharacterized protein LY89DRAFT_733393 [Mollisia scopiformis]|uniref:DUF6604 domain-containing protein n=1 Tax=Mollisia scopiformis TaxID=149040 RepID=A0A194XBL0_MOLSC|nr:uncharacterized protein LY89DRAFT_733393 [Mollisia scopiformis]KUJ17550.1 hypothetical protein LY89DRAFT_733393 [Mollisia scopiformis]
MKDSTKRHEHFISCLKAFQDLLYPFFNSARSQKSRSTQQPDGSTVELSLDNRFEALLKLDEDDNNTQENSAQTAARENSRVEKERETYELEYDIEDDLPFHVWCFFADLHRTQDFLKETWAKHAGGTLNLPTASTVTSVALELVQKAEAELVHLSPQHLNQSGLTPYLSISRYLFSDVLSEKMQCDPVKWSYLIESLLPKGRTSTSSHQAPCREEPSLPQWLRAIIGPEAMESYDFISHMMLDLYYPHLTGDQTMFSETTSNVRSEALDFPTKPEPYLDIITKSLYASCLGGSTVISAFMVRVLCDIQEILGDTIQDSYSNLRWQGAQAERKLRWGWSDLERTTTSTGWGLSPRQLLPLFGSPLAVNQAIST